MFWQEDKDPNEQASSDIVDLSFSIRCKQLPIDHTFALHTALLEHLPWFADDERVALHSIHGADSGNGWERPTDIDAVIYPSKRTKMVLRLPLSRVDDASVLSGKTLSSGSLTLQVGSASVRPLSRSSALLARYVLDVYQDRDEERFLQHCVAQLQALGIDFKKILVGRQHTLKFGDQSAVCRSIFVADLGVKDTMRLQESGIGSYQRLGCGVFIPHKTLKKV